MPLLKKIIAVCVVAAAATTWLLPSTVLAEGKPPLPAEELLTLGSPRQDAIGVRAWIDPVPGQPLKEGTRVIICVQADRDAYLTGVLVSPKGDVTIFFPNREKPDSSIKQGKVYSLFPKSVKPGLTIGKRADNPKLALYVSSRPPALDSFGFSEKTGMITIESRAADERNELKTSLESLATDAGFNRVLVSTPGDPGRYFEIGVKKLKPRLMGGPRPASRKLPTSVESSPPEGTTGVQGVRPDKPE